MGEKSEEGREDCCFTVLSFKDLNEKEKNEEKEEGPGMESPRFRFNLKTQRLY